MRLIPIAILGACLFSVVGCAGGSKTAEVVGKVTLDGEPIVEGSIQFIPIDGTSGPASGAIIRNGAYMIEADRGAAIGQNRVELRAFKNTGRKVQDPTGLPGTLTDERVPAFPPEYNEKSTLVREVKPGRNVIDFEIVLAPK